MFLSTFIIIFSLRCLSCRRLCPR